MTEYEETLGRMWHSFYKQQWNRRWAQEMLHWALALFSRRESTCVADALCEAGVMLQVSVIALCCEGWQWVVLLVLTYTKNKAKLLHQHKLSKGCRSKLSPALKEEWRKTPVKAVVWGCYILWLSARKEEETEEKENEVNANGPHPFKSQDLS